MKNKTAQTLISKYKNFIEKDLPDKNINSFLKNKISFILKRIKEDIILTPKDKKLDSPFLNELILKNEKKNNAFFVLHLDKSNKRPLNKIVFTNYIEAITEFFLTEKINLNDDIELIFAPGVECDPEFDKNIIITVK